MKTFFAIMALLFALPATAGDAESCFLETAGYPRTRDVLGCGKYIFPPKPDSAALATYAFDTAAANKIVAECRDYDGHAVGEFKQIPRVCQVIAFPSTDGKTITIGK